jgi:hypothetical protein
MVETVGEQAAVGQAGQLVVQRAVRHRVLQRPALGACSSIAPPASIW